MFFRYYIGCFFREEAAVWIIKVTVAMRLNGTLGTAASTFFVSRDALGSLA